MAKFLRFKYKESRSRTGILCQESAVLRLTEHALRRLESEGILPAVIIEAGLSLNNRYYGESLLRRSVEKFEGAPAYAYEFKSADGVSFDHIPEGLTNSQFARNHVGDHVNVRFGEYQSPKGTSKGLISDFRVVNENWRQTFKNAITMGMVDLYGHSIDAWAMAKPAVQEGTENVFDDVLQFDEVNEVTIVTDPAAGGRMLASKKADSFRLVASLQQKSEVKMEILKKVLESLMKLWPDLKGKVEFTESDNEETAVKKLEEAFGLVKENTTGQEVALSGMVSVLDIFKSNISANEGKKPDPDDEAAKKKAKEAEAKKVAESKKNEGLTEEGVKKAIAEALKTQKDFETDHAKKITEAKEKLKKQLTEAKISDEAIPEIMAVHEGQVLDDAAVNRIVASTQKMFAAFEEKGLVVHSQEREVAIAGGGDQHTKWQKALEGLFDGAPVDGVEPFQSLHHALRVVCGFNGNPGQMGRRLMSEAAICMPPSGIEHEKWFSYLREKRVSEAQRGRMMENTMTTSVLTDILGDALHKRLQKIMTLPDNNKWRMLCSNVGTATDFKDNTVLTFGGLTTLSDVSENASYTELTWPGEEKSAFKVTKRGNVLPLTFESMVDDDVNALARIPRMLGNSAQQTRTQFVLNLFTTNPVYEPDSVAIFNAAHNNLFALAFSATNLRTLITSFKKQTELSSSFRLGIPPRIIIYPVDLSPTVWDTVRTTMSSIIGRTETLENYFKEFGLITAEFATLTDADDWYMLADPRQYETIDLRFLNNRQEPELFVQNAPAVGDVFDKDVITWKIRDIYGAKWVNYRHAAASLVP